MRFDTAINRLLNEYTDLTKRTYKADFSFPGSFYTVPGGVKDLQVIFPAKDLKDALRICFLFTFSGLKRDSDNYPLVLTDEKLAEEAEQEAINWYRDYNGDSSMDDIIMSTLETHDADLDNFSDDPDSMPGYFIDEDTEVYLTEVSPNSVVSEPDPGLSTYSVDTVKDMIDKQKGLGR